MLAHRVLRWPNITSTVVLTWCADTSYKFMRRQIDSILISEIPKKHVVLTQMISTYTCEQWSI